MSRIPVPKAIICGSHVYKVLLNAKKTAGLQDRDNRGEVNHRTQTVAINGGCPDSQKTEALIHEAIHVADYVFRSGEGLKETQVACLAEGLAQILAGWGIEIDWPKCQ